MDVTDPVKKAIELLSSIAGSGTGTGTGSSEALHIQGTQRRPCSGAGFNNAAINGSCSRALAAIRSVRDRLGEGSSASVSREQQVNFAPYRTSMVRSRGQWIGKFVCLANKDASKVPCNKYDKGLLIKAGLGEKKINIQDIDCSYKQFQEAIISAFPKLSGCGGFELLRCIPNSKDLELISPSFSTSPRLLKNVIGSGRIFIRPIQKDLDIFTDTVQQHNEFTEQCIYCKDLVPVSNLRSHVQVCRWECLGKQLSESSDSDLDLPASKKICMSPELLHAENQPALVGEEIVVPSDSESISTDDDVVITERALVRHALNISSDKECSKSREEWSTIDDIMRHLRNKVVSEGSVLVVRRECVYVDALRAVRRPSFCNENRIVVKFLNEEGEDGGGLRREFWYLLLKELKSSLFEGQEGRVVPRYDVVALQERKFYFAGKLIAMSLSQDGSGFPFLAPPIYKYLCGEHHIDIVMDDIASYELRAFLEQVTQATDDQSLRDLCMANIDLVTDAGYSKPLASISLTERSVLSNTIMEHHTLHRNKAMLDQFKEGLEALEVSSLMANYGEILKPLFVQGFRTPLNADKIVSLIGEVQFSEAGSNDVLKEKATYMLFLDLVHDIEEGKYPELTLADVLNFCTGADYPPPLGFDYPITVYFSEETPYPKASTCALNLTLPTKWHDDENSFSEKMIFGILNHSGFGMS